MRGRLSFPSIVLFCLFLTLSGTAQAQWKKITTLPPAAYINALTQASLSIVAGSTNGVYVSTDNGATWQFNSLQGNYPGVNGLTQAGDTALAGTSFGIYRSTDGGSSWTDVSSSIGHTYFQGVGSVGPILLASTSSETFHSHNNGLTWQRSASDSPTVAVMNYLQVGTRVLAATGTGILASGDSGQTWTLSSTGLSNLNVHGLAHLGTKVFAGTWGSGVFVSSDSGKSWATSNSGITGDKIIENLYASDFQLFASAGNNSVWVSSDTGITWTQSAQLPFGEAHDCLVVNGTLFVATRSGVFTSTNSGTSWTFSSSGMNTLNVGGFATNGSNVYIATNYNGVFASTDGGTTWSTANGDLPYIPVGYCIAAKGQNLYFGNNSGMYRSTNGGTTWQPAVTGFNAYNPVYDFLFSGDSLFSAGSYGVFVSTDSAATWKPDTTGLPTRYVTGLAQNGSTLYTFPYNTGIYKWSNASGRWLSANSGITLPGAVYGFAKIDTTLFLGSSNGIYFSNDEASTWSTTGPFAHTYTRCLTNVGLYLFAGVPSGIYVSADKSQTWQYVAAGLGILSNGINHLAVSGNTLLIDVGNDGVWSRNLAEMVPFVSAGVSSIIFPHVNLLDSSSITLSFRNMIGHPLSVSSISVSHPSVLHLSTAGPFSLASVDSFSVTITFKPSTLGQVSDSLTIIYAGGTAAIPISGLGTGAPTVQISSANVDFGNVTIGQSKNMTVTITNGGTDTLNVSSTAIDGTGFTTKNPSFRVLAGQSFNDTIRFVPTIIGHAMAYVKLTSNASSSPDTIHVAGFGLSVAGVGADESALPTVYALRQNYPNPFNPSTSIPYDLPERSYVRIGVYNVLGQEVSELINGEQPAGFRSVSWFANVASGIYFYRLEATSLQASKKHFVAVRKIVLLK